MTWKKQCHLLIELYREQMKSKVAVGFEPTNRLRLPVFKTGAFNRSATHPLDSIVLTKLLELVKKIYCADHINVR